MVEQTLQSTSSFTSSIYRLIEYGQIRVCLFLAAIGVVALVAGALYPNLLVPWWVASFVVPGLLLPMPTFLFFAHLGARKSVLQVADLIERIQSQFGVPGIEQLLSENLEDARSGIRKLLEHRDPETVFRLYMTRIVMDGRLRRRIRAILPRARRRELRRDAWRLLVKNRRSN